MTSFDSLLYPFFRDMLQELQKELQAQGFLYRPFSQVRTLGEQARLWRQSRSKEEIDARIEQLQSVGASMLARKLEEVGPQHGRHVTNALPGDSWHNYGFAVDFVRIIDGKASWEIADYEPLAEAAKKIGLHSGFYWEGFQDAVHIQYFKGSPKDYFPRPITRDFLMSLLWEISAPNGYLRTQDMIADLL